MSFSGLAMTAVVRMPLMGLPLSARSLGNTTLALGDSNSVATLFNPS